MAGPPLPASATAAAAVGAAAAAAPHRRVRLRTTAHMRMLALIVLLMAIAAINYQSNAAWALVMGLISVLGISILHTRRNLLLLRVVSCRCPPVFAQEEAEAVVTLSATGMAAADITVTILQPNVGSSAAPSAAADRAPDGAPTTAPKRVPTTGTSTGISSTSGSVAQVSCEQPQEVRCRMPGRRRGVNRRGRVRLSTTYPLGLFVASWEQDVELVRVVYPAALGSMPLNAEAVSQSAAGASSSATAVQSGTDDFSGHRRFSEGDPLTLIDWKAHARGGPLLIKRFTGAASSVVWCEWQATHGAREERLSQLAAWLVEAEHRGLRFGLRLPGREVAPDLGAAHLHACLLLLAEEPG